MKNFKVIGLMLAIAFGSVQPIEAGIFGSMRAFVAQRPKAMLVMAVVAVACAWFYAKRWMPKPPPKPAKDSEYKANGTEADVFSAIDSQKTGGSSNDPNPTKKDNVAPAKQTLADCFASADQAPVASFYHPAINLRPVGSH